GPNGIKTLEAKLNDAKLIMIPEDREKMETDLSRKQRMIRLLYQMKERHDKKVDKAAWDDIVQKDTLYLCVNKEYEFNFRAKDVIHSAFFPHFRAQMNTVPGMVTRFKFTPDITTKDMRERMNNPKFNYVVRANGAGFLEKRFPDGFAVGFADDFLEQNEDDSLHVGGWEMKAGVGLTL
ncbi:MAG: hypothetical protein ACKPB0_12610, partial [Opitutaceae bacterium]